MIYEIINPSDAVTIEADDEMVACVATLLIGEGKMGLMRYPDGESVLPLFMFDGFEEWQQAHGLDLASFLVERRGEIADCLASAVCCQASERAAVVKAIEAAGGDIQEALRVYNDEKRSSLNDICDYAHSRAAQLRAADAEQEGKEA